jgi:hypothetical protein
MQTGGDHVLAAFLILRVTCWECGMDNELRLDRVHDVGDFIAVINISIMDGYLGLKVFESPKVAGGSHEGMKENIVPQQFPT